MESLDSEWRMVKSWVCPRCLGDLETFYVEEGDTLVTSDRVVCPGCGYTLEGSIDLCSETEIRSEESEDQRHSSKQ